MKKRFLLLALSLLLVLALTGLVSCGESEITGLSFTDKTVEYNGEAHTIELTGAPSGATVTYSPSNSFTDAGVYTVTATVKAEGYLDTTLTATLTVSPKQLTVEWGSLNFPANGKTPTPSYTLSGFIGEDESELTFDFGGCDFKKAGESFTMTATPKNTNYTLGAEGTKSLKVGSSNVTVTFDSGIASKEVEPQTVKAGRKAEDPGRVSKVGYEFDGWYLGDKKWDFEADKVEEDITLLARFIPIEYNIGYHPNGGTNNPENPTTFTVETTEQLKAPTREGYIFLGWYEDRDLTVEAGKLGTVRKNLELYAKWAPYAPVGYIPVASLGASNPTVSTNVSALGNEATVVLVADVTSFSEDGVICFGIGKDNVDGSYIKLTRNEILSITNGVENEIHSDKKTHIREIVGYVVIEATIANGEVKVLLHTGEGKTETTSLKWSGRSGELFAYVENAELTDVTLSWKTDATEKEVWILAGEEFDGSDLRSYAHLLYENGFNNYFPISAHGLTAAGALDIMQELLGEDKPNYAVWSFATESGAEYDAALNSFLSLCANNGITPILTTQPTALSEANEAKNAFVVSSGRRYIDLADAAEYGETIVNKTVTEQGVANFYARFVADFPEITAPKSLPKRLHADTLTSLNPGATSGAPDGSLYSNGNAIKDGKFLIFSAKLDGTLDGDEKISFGQGYYESTGTWLELTESEAIVCTYRSWTNPNKSEKKSAHGLTIKGFVTVIISLDQDDMGNRLSIYTEGGAYTTSVNWTGQVGEMVAFPTGLTLTDVSFSFTCADYSKDFWVIGDSYLSLGDTGRWPTYLYKEGYQNSLMIGYSGMRSAAGVTEFKDALNYDTPKYLVWCMGMNDGDKNGVLNESYVSCVSEVLSICKEKGIVPIISTIPTCLAVENNPKNNLILNKLGVFEDYDYLVVDCARAVDGYADQANATWYPGMLHTDNVHPALLGAKALYMQIIAEFPELIDPSAEAVATRVTEESFTPGKVISLPGSEEQGRETVLTFTADINGAFGGTLIFGNGNRGEKDSSWVEISDSKLKICHNVGDKTVTVAEIDNLVEFSEIVTVKLHIKGTRATVSVQSTAEKTEIGAKIFSVEGYWCPDGELYAETVELSLSNANIRWFTFG